MHHCLMKKILKVPLFDEKNSQGSSDVKEFPPKKTGHPLLLGEKLDQQVRHYLAELHTQGGIVNTHIAITDGVGIGTSSVCDWICKNLPLTHKAQFSLPIEGFIITM